VNRKEKGKTTSIGRKSITYAGEATLKKKSRSADRRGLSEANRFFPEEKQKQRI